MYLKAHSEKKSDSSIDSFLDKEKDLLLKLTLELIEGSNIYLSKIRLKKIR